LKALGVGVAYYLGAVIGLWLVITPTPVSTIWPPNAILLAALLLTPPRIWWLLLLAAFPGHLVAELQGGVPLSMAVCWFISNALQALLGAGAIRAFDREGRLDNVRSFTLFVIFGVILAPFAASFLDAGFVRWHGWGGADYWQVWRMRFFANVLTTLTIVPVGLALFTRDETLHDVRRARAEAIALLLALMVVGNIVFSRPGVHLHAEPALLYAPLPLLLWAALRFGLAGVSVGVLVIVVLAIRAAMHGRGPFVDLSPAENVLSLELLMITIALPLMLLAVLLDERRGIEAARREGEQRYRDVVESQTELICRFRPDTALTFVNDAYCRHTGAPREALLGRSFIERIPDDARPDVARHVARIFTPSGRDQAYVYEHAVLQPDGRRGWQVWTARPIVGPNGRVVEAQAIGRDVTDQRLAEQAVRERDEALRASYDRIQELAGRLIRTQEDERRRIARELHDDVNQQLAAVAIGLSGARRIVGDSVPASGELAQLQERVVALTDDIRRLCHELHPVTLVHVGLAASLRAHCAEFCKATGIDVVLSVGDDMPAVPPAMALCFYRVLQEALHNVARHSRARVAHVRLRHAGDALELSIRDDGVGFDLGAARAQSGGLGLISIEERVRLVHGTMQILAAPGRGVEVLARAPLALRQALSA
jgi:PAS domain S-box-containing protein